MKIDNNWSIEYDENNVILVYSEPKTRIKKNGSKEDYIYRNMFYYPNIKTALKSYLNRCLKGSGSINEVLSKINEVEQKIDNYEKK